MEAFEAIDVDVRTNTEVIAIEKDEGLFIVHTRGGGESAAVHADLVVHAAGRTPALEQLDLPTGGVAAESGALLLNEYLQSVSNPSVYAAGDAAQVGGAANPGLES